MRTRAESAIRHDLLPNAVPWPAPLEPATDAARPVDPADPAHAPGHRHLSRDEGARSLPRGRQQAKAQRAESHFGLRHQRHS